MIGTAADSHQSQQSRVELRHRQLSKDAEDKHDSKNQDPRHHLKAMKVDAPSLSQKIKKELSYATTRTEIALLFLQVSDSLL
jgi:hypothetical protein